MDEHKTINAEEVELTNSEAEQAQQPQKPEVDAEEVAPVAVMAADPTASEAPSVKEKKPLDKKKLMIIGGGVAAALVAFIIIFFTVIQPNAIYNQAVEALENADFFECQQLIDKIPNHSKVPELKKDLTCAMAENYIKEGNLDMAESLLATLPGDKKALKLKQDIQYLQAVDLAEQGKIDEAKLLLDKIPNHEDPNQLREKINYESALAALETGNYKEAYELFSQLGDYEDAAQQKDIVYYEALAFKSLFNIQPTLKNPASLRVTKVTFYQDSSNEGELDAVYEITATNSYGGSIGGYVYDLTLYDESEDSGMISQSTYYDPDDYYDLLIKYLIDGIRTQTVFETTVDVARMNRLLIANVSFNIDLPFAAADAVES